MIELELKAVVADPDACRARLRASRALPGFRGLMLDRRFDRAGELLARDQVVRVRHYRDDGGNRARVTWKGPSRVVDGYKERAEIEFDAAGDSPEDFLQALGYHVTESIDRRVEYYTTPAEAVVRLEWYPRMDVLVEVEGSPHAIESAIAELGIDRREFTPESLAAFVARYEQRTGRPAIVSLERLGGDRPGWELG